MILHSLWHFLGWNPWSLFQDLLGIFCQMLFHREMLFQYLFSFFWKDIQFSLGLEVGYLIYIRLFNFFIQTETLCIKLVQNPVKQHFSAACCLTGAALYQIPISPCRLGFQKDPLTLNMPWSVLYRDQRSHMTDDEEPQSGWRAGERGNRLSVPMKQRCMSLLEANRLIISISKSDIFQLQAWQNCQLWSHDLKHWRRMLWNCRGPGMVVIKQVVVLGCCSSGGTVWILLKINIGNFRLS